MKPTHIAAALVLSAASFAPVAATAQSATATTPAATINQTPQTTASPNPSAVQTNNTMSRTSAAPVAGRNSFTQGEASKRIASAGFTGVTGLKKDGQGIWRGTAQKGGSSVGVALDYQGNVVSQ